MHRKSITTFVAAFLVGMTTCVKGALVDTDGNAATNQTLLGDIDMGVGTLGDLKTFVSTGAVEEAKNFTRTNAVLWHDNMASNITVGPVNSIGNSSLSFSDEDGNYNIGYCSIAFGYVNSVGNYSSAFGDDNFVGHYASAFGEDNDIGSSAFAVGDRNQLGSYSYAFGFDNYARIDDGDGGYSYKDLAFLMGAGNLTEADGSFAMGVAHHAGEYAQASFSFGTTTEALHPGAFVWSFYPTNFFDMSVEDILALPRYQSHGIGSFNINPIGGLSNFWVGETNMSDHVVNIVAPLALGMKNQVISDLEDGDIIPLKTDNLRDESGANDYTATELLRDATNASNFAAAELARTNSVLVNGPYVQSASMTNTVRDIVTNTVTIGYTDWVYSGNTTAGTTYTINVTESGADYVFTLYNPSELGSVTTNILHPTRLDFTGVGIVAECTPIIRNVNGLAMYSDVQALETKIDTMDTSYYRVVGITNKNQSVQFVETDANTTSLQILMPESGMTKDWLVYVKALTNLTLVLPPADYWVVNESVTNEIPPLVPTALYFSQISDNTYSIGRQELIPITVLSQREIENQLIRAKMRKARRLSK